MLEKDNMNAYQTILRLTDDTVPLILAARQRDPGRRDFGGQITPEKGFAEPGHSCSAAGALLAVYFCPDSRWHGDESLLDAAISSLSFLNGSCHEDGTIDLLETNFHDCTSSGFAVQSAAYTYRLLKREAKTPKEREAETLARAFLEKSAQAMITGGFHTPNHRWVVASALALCYRCLGDPECLQMARVYLSEGIDCNDEGDYTERSVGLYDVVNNESLTILAQELDMPELCEAVDRNLHKNWYYIEPDMTALTLASRRQDYGTDARMLAHFHSYYQAALRTGSGSLAWMANRLLEQMERQRTAAGSSTEPSLLPDHRNLLTRFLLEPEREMPAEEPMPLVYDRYFESAGVVRHRAGRWTCSLLRDNGTFMKLQNGCLAMYVKLACTFFQHGRLLAEEIVPIEGGYRLSCAREWGYVRPLPGIQEADWWKIDHAAREKVNIQKHRWQADVLFWVDGVTLRIRTEGTPRIPVKLECILPPSGLLHTAGMTIPALPGGWAVAGETIAYDWGGESIRLSGGFNEHHYAPNMRNSDPPPTGRFCLYCTDFTPVDRTIEITMA